jgi:hypothetical protein
VLAGEEADEARGDEEGGEEVMARAGGRPHARLGAIVEATAAFYGLTDVDVIGGAKSPRIVRARRVAALLLREIAAASYSEIGKELGYADHSAVHQAVGEMKELAKTDEVLRADLEAIRQAVAAPKPDPLKERLDRLELELASLRDEFRRRL